MLWVSEDWCIVTYVTPCLVIFLHVSISNCLGLSHCLFNWLIIGSLWHPGMQLSTVLLEEEVAVLWIQENWRISNSEWKCWQFYRISYSRILLNLTDRWSSVIIQSHPNQYCCCCAELLPNRKPRISRVLKCPKIDKLRKAETLVKHTAW